MIRRSLPIFCLLSSLWTSSAQAQPKEGEDPLEPKKDAAATAKPDATKDPAEPPAGGSEPGTASPSYDEGKNRPPAAPDATRAWEEPPGTSEEDVVLAVPRAILFFPNLIVKTVFIPLRALATAVDEYALVERTKNLLYFNDEQTAGIFPTATVQTGYGLSVGARIFHNNLFGHEEHVSARATYGGLFQQGYQFLFDGDRIGGSRLWLEARVRYEKKPAILFYGIGDAPKGSSDLRDIDPRAASVATRFRQERFLALLRMGPTLGHPGNLTQVGMTASFNRRAFGPEEKQFDEPSIGQVYDTSRLNGFNDTLHIAEVDLNVYHDGTDHPEFPSTGTYVELFGGRAHSLQDDFEFWHYGAEISGFINLYRGDRVLVLRGAVESVDGDGDKIPFTELPRLGGPQRLRCYVQDRFRDELAATGTLEYRYPVHDYVSGALFVDAGRVGIRTKEVFGKDAYEDWRVGAGGGLTFHSKDRESVIFRVELGYGDGFTALFSTDPLRAFSRRSRQL